MTAPDPLDGRPHRAAPRRTGRRPARGSLGRVALGVLPLVSGCFGLRLTVAPTIDTASNVGVEARIGGEIDFLVVHAGGGGGGGWVSGQAASAWQIGGGASVPLSKPRDFESMLDLDIHYSGYFLHAVQSVNPDESPYAHGVRFSGFFRHVVAHPGRDNMLHLGVGLFGEAVFREARTLGIFGLPIGIHLLAMPHVKL